MSADSVPLVSLVVGPLARSLPTVEDGGLSWELLVCGGGGAPPPDREWRRFLRLGDAGREASEADAHRGGDRPFGS